MAATPASWATSTSCSATPPPLPAPPTRDRSRTSPPTSPAASNAPTPTSVHNKSGPQAPIETAGRPRRRLTFAVDDLVLYWEPQQRAILHAEPHADDLAIAVRAPAKWTPKWTGPHKVLRKLASSTGHRYTIAHIERGIEIDTHVNKLCRFDPWSERTPSTSWEIDAQRPFQTGTWAAAGTLVVVPLDRPYPFGIGKVLQAAADGTLDIQWLGSTTNNIKGAFDLGWTTPRTLAPYYAATRRRDSHRPYRVAEDATVAFHQRDIVLHGFTLTAARRLPAPVLRAIAAHPDVWWDDTMAPRPDAHAAPDPAANP